MRNLLYIFSSFVFWGCAATNSQPEKMLTYEDKETNKIFQIQYNSLLHVKVGSVIKNFYCSKSHWPETMVELSQYNPNYSYISKSDWASLLEDNVKFKVSTKSIRLTTPTTKVNSRITSIHGLPDCEKNISRVSFGR